MLSVCTCVQTRNRDMRDEALTGMLDGVLTELHSFPNSTGVINVRRYIEKALFPFAMNQVLLPAHFEITTPQRQGSNWLLKNSIRKQN